MRRKSESGVSWSAMISRITGTRLPRRARSSKTSCEGRSTLASGGAPPPAAFGRGIEIASGFRLLSNGSEGVKRSVAGAGPARGERVLRVVPDPDEPVDEPHGHPGAPVLLELQAGAPAGAS